MDEITSPLRIVIDGRRYWRFLDGTILPVVSGGDGEEGEEEGEVITIEAPPEEEEEEAPPAPAKSKSTRVFTAEEVEKIRRQERDKLYKNQEDLNERLRVLTEEAEARKKAEEAQRRAAEKAAKDAEAAEKKRQEEEMSAKELIAAKEQEWQNRLSHFEEQIAIRDAALEREREYAELQGYRLEQLSEHEDEIMPELRSYVTGFSKEEIDASIASAIETTSSILGQVSQAQQQQRQQMRTTGPTGAPPVSSPLEGQNVERYTADDLRNMSMADYAKRRSQLLRGGSRQQGLFD